ncbi:MAG: hypothetical protein AB1801_24940 [Chloroflexota bacterium]
MHRYNNLPGQPGRTALRRRQGLRQSLELMAFSLLVAVTLITFLCAIIASAVSQTASLVALRPTITRTSLPTFTPTSLPTLTPTTSSIHVAGATSPPPPVHTPASTPGVVAVQPNTSGGAPTSIALAPAGTPPSPAAVASPASISVPPNGAGSAVASSTAPRPTFTPTQTRVPPTPTPWPTATATVPRPVSTPLPAASGWSFNGVTNLAGDSGEGLLLMGELVNGTGAPQHAVAISGAFYGLQDELVVDTLEVVSYVPIDPVPADAHVPFELQVSGSQGIDRFDLRARSEPASAGPRQDFQFSAVEQWVSNALGYCMRGQVDNQGPPLQEYLIVLAIGYDDQGSVVNFGEYYADILPDSDVQSSTFEMCLDPLDRQISRHDLRAFGY